MCSGLELNMLRIERRLMSMRKNYVTNDDGNAFNA